MYVFLHTSTNTDRGLHILTSETGDKSAESAAIDQVEEENACIHAEEAAWSALRNTWRSRVYPVSIVWYSIVQYSLV